MPQTEQSFSKTISQTASLGYWLYLPPNYDSQATWPLILFLHGYGERGSNLELVAQIGLAKRIAAGDNFPFIIASPHTLARPLA